MGWRRPSTPLTESWLSPSTSMGSTSPAPETWELVVCSHFPCRNQLILVQMRTVTQWYIQFVQDIGAGKGKYYAVNYPLRDGIDDESYEAIFKPVSLFLWSNYVNIHPPSAPPLEWTPENLVRKWKANSREKKDISEFFCVCFRSWPKSWRCTSQVLWFSSVEPILFLETDWAASTSPSKV